MSTPTILFVRSIAFAAAIQAIACVHAGWPYIKPPKTIPPFRPPYVDNQQSNRHHESLPTLNEHLRDLKRQYNIVEYESGFPTRWDALSHSVPLQQKLLLMHHKTANHTMGAVPYRHAFGTRYLSYAAAKFNW